MTDTTKAETLADGAQMNLPTGVLNGGGILGAAVTLAIGFLALRKRWSRDNLELTKDRVETNLIATLEKTIAELREENKRLDERAREAWRSRAEDAKLIGELSSKVEHLTKSNESLETHVEQLTAMVRRLLPEKDRHLFDQAPHHFHTKEKIDVQIVPSPAP